MDNNKTVSGYYEDGEITFAGPVDMDGCWRVQIVFLEREDVESTPFEADPHRLETLMSQGRMEELHRRVESTKPTVGPY